MLLQYFMLDGLGLGVVINLFIITPSAVSIGLLLKYLYICPFTETVEFQRKYAKYELTVRLIGRLTILPIMVIMFGSLIIACLFSSNRDVPMILVNYFVYVQFYGVLLALAKVMLLYVDNYYYQLSLFGLLDILCIGRIFKERILAEKLMVNVDYAYRIHTYLFGLIIIQKILGRDDAIKANWISSVVGEVGIGVEGDETRDIEMKGLASNDKPFVAPRNSTTFSIDAIYSTTDEEVGCSVSYGNDSNSNSIAATTNPIHSVARTQHQESVLRLQQSAINTNSEDKAEDEAALFLEYQNLQSNHDDAVYDMTEDTEISFEEWKTRRKQFKQGI